MIQAMFKIEGRLPGLNEIIAATNNNRYGGAYLKKKETKRCMWAVIAGNVPAFSVPVRVAFHWIEPNLKRDPDNIAVGAKFVLDALVELGRLPNDSRKWVKEVTHVFAEPDPKNPRVEVEIVATGPPRA